MAIRVILTNRYMEETVVEQETEAGAYAMRDDALAAGLRVRLEGLPQRCCLCGEVIEGEAAEAHAVCLQRQARPPVELLDIVGWDSV